MSRAADQDAVLAHALSRRAASWQAAAARARALMSGKTEVATASRLLEDYRLLARDLLPRWRFHPEVLDPPVFTEPGTLPIERAAEERL